jgi:hypothetical protein
MREGRLLQHPYPDVLAQVDATKEGNKSKFSEKKIYILLTKQKWQCKEGRFKAFKYFNNIKEKKLTWTEVLFNNGKVDSYSKNADSMEYLCHGENKLTSKL